MPDSGISTFWIFFFSTCVILNYTGKQLVSRDLQDRHLFNFAANWQQVEPPTKAHTDKLENTISGLT